MDDEVSYDNIGTASKKEKSWKTQFARPESISNQASSYSKEPPMTWGSNAIDLSFTTNNTCRLFALSSYAYIHLSIDYPQK